MDGFFFLFSFFFQGRILYFRCSLPSLFVSFLFCLLLLVSFASFYLQETILAAVIADCKGHVATTIYVGSISSSSNTACFRSGLTSHKSFQYNLRFRKI